MIPKLRFSEFQDDFKADKLGHLITSFSGGTPSASNKAFYDGDIPFIKSGEINDAQTEQFINEIALAKSSAKIVNKGDLLLALYGATSGEIAISKLEGAINQAVLCIRSERLNLEYLKFWFELNKGKILRKYLQGGQGNLSASIVKSLSILYPSLNEQIKTATVLKSVDQKINLLTKKKEALETYKKGLMQKIFSQELRFKDEDGTDYTEWDTHYVAELGEFFNGLSGKNSSHFGHGDSQYVQYSQVFRHSYIRIEECGNVEVDDSDKQHALKVGDALFTTSSEVADEVAFASILLIEPKINTYLNSFCFGLRLNDLLTPSFAQYLFRTTTFRKAVYPLAQGSTRYNVSKKEVGKVKLLIPSVEEQNHISKSLRILDSRIDQLILLKNKTEQLKKGLLQKMFV